MGYEYALRFESPDPTAVAAVLRRLPAARELPLPTEGFEFQAVSSTHGMPDAVVQTESYGVYFCDYGGHGREFLGLIVARLVSEFGAVTVAELE